MSAAVLAAGAHDNAPITLSRDERLAALFAPVRDMSSLMAFVVAGSVAAHAVLVAFAFVGARAPLPAPKEIAVEIVQEAPKPPPASPPKPPEAAKPARMVRPAPLPAPPPRKVAPQPPKAAPPRVKAARPSAPEASLQDEIEKLRAEQAALKAELAGAAAAKTSAGSGKALALAAATDGDGDPFGYQQIVFSQLAKAKDRDGFHGATGTTGVRFEIAATGALAGVDIVTPSGDADLDKEALAIVRRAAPFPPPPKDAERIVFANVNFVPPRRL